MLKYFGSIFTIDNIHKASGVADADRGLTFTFYDPSITPSVPKESFLPGYHGQRYNSQVPALFQQQIPLCSSEPSDHFLGTSFAVNQGVDVFTTMTKSQGSFVKRPMTFPTGFVEESADDLHTATYAAGSKDSSLLPQRFTDDYTNVRTVNKTYSKVGFSFILGILSSLLAYLIGIPAGISMARKKTSWATRSARFISFSVSPFPPCVHLHG